MRILHVPFTFHPDPVGGTEIYVDALARAQRDHGIDGVIAAPGNHNESYAHGVLRVHRFRVTESVDDIRELYGEGDGAAAIVFGEILDRERPDVVHVHAFTRGASLRLVREARRRGTPVILSYHTPTVSCQRGTLLRWGSDVCNGVLDVKACTQCTLHGMGLSKTTSRVAGSLPNGLGRGLGALGLSGGMWTALRMTELVTLRQAAFTSLMAEVDHVVALCEWVKTVLVRNCVPAEKITVSRQGLCHTPHENRVSPDRPRRDTNSPSRIMFAGRLDATKGAHILIQALRDAPEIPLQLDVYGISQGEAGAAYLQRLREIAGNDARVTFREAIRSEEILSHLRNYEVLAVPSQCLETGPMVVLEAFAARVPVIGSDLGGIAELVTDGRDGLLVKAGSVGAWTQVLRRITHDQDVLATLRRGIRPPRLIDACAAELRTIYERVAPAFACA
jgi:glycosyltransferase involved in cell wall biosynthesis